MVDRPRPRRTTPTQPRLRWDRLLIYALVLAAVFAGGYLVARAATTDDPPPQQVAAATTNYQVVEGSVGSTVRLIARAAWDGTPVAANPAVGVITSVDVGAGGQVSPGDVVYRVDQRPVSAAAGTVPSFRDLEAGASGQDVRQLQELLASLGLYEGEVDGVYGTGMAAAVISWQESLGLTGDGAVLQGDLIVVPELPARLAPTEAIRPGAVVVGGEAALAAIGDGPVFLVELPAGEPPVVSASSGVLVDPDGQRWEALVSGMAETPTGEPALTLTGSDGGPVCGQDCGEAVPFDQTVLYPVDITVVPTTTGPMVPVAALQPDGADGWMVRLADGDEVPVTVLAAANGWAVVEGLAVGEEVVLSPGGGPSSAEVAPSGGSLTPPSGGVDTTEGG
jgi:peptidoglycan hydrolase-like protein with peptidoglycan-binding domain